MKANPVALPALGPFRCVEVFREDVGQGVGRGAAPWGGDVLLMWASGQAGERLRDKARVLAQQVSDCVPRFIAMGRQGGLTVAVVEWKEGQVLGSGRCPSEEEVSSLIWALERLHADGWVHGDVAPGNIVVSEQLGIGLIDWEFLSRVSDLLPPGTPGFTGTDRIAQGAVATPRADFDGLRKSMRRAFQSGRKYSGCGAEVGGENSDDAPELRAIDDARSGRAPSTATLNCAVSSVAAIRVAATLLYALPACREAVRSISSVPVKIAPVNVAYVDTPDSGEAIELALVIGLSFDAGLTCVSFSDLVGRCLATQGEHPGRAIGTRGALSNAVAKIHRELSECERAPSVVFCRSPSRPELTAAWQLLLSWNRHGHLRLVDVRTNGQGDARQEVGMNFARSCISRIMPRTVPSNEVLKVLGRQRSLVDCVEALRRGVLRGTIDIRDGGLAVVAPDLELQLHGAAIDKCCCGLSDGIECPNFWEVLACADELSVGRRVRKLARHVDALERLAGESSDREQRGDSLVELLLELGDTSRALRLLGKRELGLSAWSKAQILICMNEVDGLAEVERTIWAEVDARQCTKTRARARYVTAARKFLQGERRLVVQELRAALREAKCANDEGLFLSGLVALGNVSRASGRGYTARRILRLARATSATSGGIRHDLNLELNQLLCEADVLPPRELAVRWHGMAELADAWGAQTFAAACQVRESRCLLGAGEVRQALSVAEEAQDLVDSGAPVGAFWKRELKRVWATASHAAGRLGAVLAVRTDGGDQVGSAEVLAVQAWIEMELFGSIRSPCSELLRGVRSVEVRAARVAARWGEKPRGIRRSTRVVEAFASKLPRSSVAMAQLARVFARGAPDSRFLHSLVRWATLRASASGMHRDFCFAIVSLAAAWRGVRAVRRSGGSGVALNTVTDRVGVGIRDWEETLARAINGVVWGGEEGETELALRGLRRLDEFVRALGPELGRRYIEVIPLGMIASLFVGESMPPDAEVSGSSRLSWLLKEVPQTASREPIEVSSSVGHMRERLRAAGSIEAVAQVALPTLLRSTCADRVALLFHVRGVGRAAVVDAHGIAFGPLAAGEASEGILDRARRMGSTCLVQDAESELSLRDRPSVRRVRVKTAIASVLRRQGLSLGFLYLERRNDSHPFRDSEVRLVEEVVGDLSDSLSFLILRDERDEFARALAEVTGARDRERPLVEAGLRTSEVVHDLRNVLTAVSGEAQFALSELDSDAMADALGSIVAAAADGAEIVDRLLNEARSTRRKFGTGTDLYEFLHEVRVRASHSRASQIERLNVKVDVSAPTGLVLRTNERQVREVLLNLVHNAVDACGVGGRVELAGRRIPRGIEITVSDSGSGMSEEQLALAFEPFYTTKGSAGTGLGLSVARRLIRDLGGDIEMSSTLGKGTAVRVIVQEAETLETESCIDSSQVEPTSRQDLPHSPPMQPAGTRSRRRRR